jgi:hypothetical protein
MKRNTSIFQHLFVCLMGSLFVLVFLTGVVRAEVMESVRIADDKKGFVLHP